MPQMTITWSWDDGKKVTITGDQFEVLSDFAKDRESLTKLMRFLAEMPGASRL